MQFIDIGVNFHSGQLAGKTAELLDRARAVGVSHFLATGTSLHASEQALELAGQHPDIWATAGVHPHDAKSYSDTTGTALNTLWQQERVVAVGECGLDYNRMFSPREAQLKVFEHHLQAAARVRKPLFLHCRDAFDDFHAMLKDTASQGVGGVVHCFTGTAAQAEDFLALGLDIGITGWVTDTARGSELRDAMRVIPLQRLHLETDAPYLRPKNAKKTRPYNEPALLPHVAEVVAQLKGVPLDELARHATANSRRLFNLPG